MFGGSETVALKSVLCIFVWPGIKQNISHSQGPGFLKPPRFYVGGKTGIQIPITNLGREHNLSIIEKMFWATWPPVARLASFCPPVHTPTAPIRPQHPGSCTPLNEFAGFMERQSEEANQKTKLDTPVNSNLYLKKSEKCF